MSTSAPDDRHDDPATEQQIVELPDVPSAEDGDGEHDADASS